GGFFLEIRVVGVELQRASDEDLLALYDLRVREAAFDGAYSLAGFVVIEADAFGAEIRVDHVDFVALADGLVRALGLARATVDAIFGDVSRHGLVLRAPSPATMVLEAVPGGVNELHGRPWGRPPTPENCPRRALVALPSCARPLGPVLRVPLM